MDMGGASTQVAVQCLAGDCPGGIAMNIYDTEYNVSASSLLCYGLEEAMRRFLAAIILDEYLNSEGNEVPSQISNPCMNSLASKVTFTNRIGTFNCSYTTLQDDWLELFQQQKAEIFSSACTVTTNANFNNAISELPDNFNFTYSADFNLNLCRIKMDQLITVTTTYIWLFSNIHSEFLI